MNFYEKYMKSIKIVKNGEKESDIINMPMFNSSCWAKVNSCYDPKHEKIRLRQL